MAKQSNGNSNRKAEISRQTKETQIRLALNLDGSGKSAARTGVGFFDHMLDLLARHSLIDMSVDAKGDLEVDAHHTVEGRRHRARPGDRERQWATSAASTATAGRSCRWTSLCAGRASIFPAGRLSCLTSNSRAATIGEFPVEAGREFWKSVATNAQDEPAHHRAVRHEQPPHLEAIFKATAKALRQAVSHDPRNADVPSTKGSLNG
jgi:imidazoleglycerol-phosphate dehydratase